MALTFPWLQIFGFTPLSKLLFSFSQSDWCATYCSQKLKSHTYDIECVTCRRVSLFSIKIPFAYLSSPLTNSNDFIKRGNQKLNTSHFSSVLQLYERKKVFRSLEFRSLGNCDSKWLFVAFEKLSKYLQLMRV
jgi:hypothetical protein